MNKAIRRSGSKKNYWDIYFHLPKETRGYVPAFIAAMYTFNYHKEHNIYPLDNELPTMCDTIVISDALHFEQICEVAGCFRGANSGSEPTVSFGCCASWIREKLCLADALQSRG